MRCRDTGVLLHVRQGDPGEHNLGGFQLVSSRYERASLIVTSNKEFGRWGEVFGDDTVPPR